MTIKDGTSNDDILKHWDIVIVTFNSADALVNSWADAPAILRDRVICVDNSSNDDTLVIARSLFRKVLSHSNDGLSVANNYGAQHGRSQYVLFANPDLVPRAEDFAEIMMHLDKHGGLAAPRLVGANGQPQENARGWPTLKAQISNRLIPSLAQSYRWPVGVDGVRRVPWLTGACIAVTRSDLALIGFWPEDYFLYYEDVVLSLSAWRAGLPVTILNSIRWFHEWRRASKNPINAGSLHHIVSAFHFFRTHPEFLLIGPRDQLS